MTIHQCPKCELRFDWKTELDDHCWHDHPQFRHEYPARPAPAPAAEPAPHAAPMPAARARIGVVESLFGWLVPARQGDRTEVSHAPQVGRAPNEPTGG